MCNRQQCVNAKLFVEKEPLQRGIVSRQPLQRVVFIKEALYIVLLIISSGTLYRVLVNIETLQGRLR